jgi:DDE superfamily endonuclease
MFSIANPRPRRTASRRAQRPSSSHQRRTQRHASQSQRQRQTRKAHAARQKARAARRQLQRIHEQAPSQARALLDCLAGAFTRPTFLRFVVLTLAAILTLGNRTLCNLLRTVGALAPGHPSSYHRVFSHRRWSLWGLARRLTGWVLDHLVPDGTVFLAGDDTVDEHCGDKVFGKGCHRDAVRSSHNYTAYRWGHKWVVLAILVRFPFCRRQWALPVLVALYHGLKDDAAHSRRHKTPQRLLRQLNCLLLRWFRPRRFVLTGDGNFATHELARFASKRRGRLALVSRFYAKANLVEPPPLPSGKKRRGRPRIKGAKLPTPQEVVARSKRTHLNVSWYGGGHRDVAVVSGVAHWYKAGDGLVEVRWVFVQDRTGTHRDEYFMSTDAEMTAQEVIEAYVARWNEETTFEEMRSYLGLETTRGWKQATVLRVGPCLFGLYTVVACLYSQLPKRWRREHAIEWPGKAAVSYSDAITAVRRWLWVEWVFATPAFKPAFAKLSRPFRKLLLHALAPSA